MFNGIWLVATEPLTIQGRDLKAGERFHVSRVHSGALLVTGKATILKPQPPPKSQMPEPPPEPPKRRGRTRKADAPPPQVAPEPEPVAEIPETPAVVEPVDPTEDSDVDTIAASRECYMRRDLRADE
jgi:hypothetical protein